MTNHETASSGSEVEALLARAVEHHRAGRLDDAATLYRQVLEVDPRHAGAMHQLGGVLLARGDIEQAQQFIQKAVDLRPDEALFHNNLGHILKERRRLPEAEASFRRAIELRPDYAMAFNNLGTVLQEGNRLSDAERCYRRALERQPGYIVAMSNLARVLHKQGQIDEALDVIHAAIQRQPSSAVLYRDLGNALLEKGEPEQAIEVFRHSLARDSADPMVHHHLGRALQRLGRLSEAHACLQQALNLDPDNTRILKNLASVCQDRGDKQAATDQYLRVLDIDPNDASARHLLAAVTGEQTDAAPTQYVVELFDDYAERFDEHLAELGYRVPERLRDIVVQLTGVHQADWRILDLGCGTGLSGACFRSLAVHLTGVDLSAGMLRKAQQRGVYDCLLNRDVSDALEEVMEPVDLVLATDVFVYIGNLARIFAATGEALRSGGLFAFSTESTEGRPFRLRDFGRYAHDRSYVEMLADEYGFAVAYIETTILRDGDKPVDGFLFVLEKTVR